MASAHIPGAVVIIVKDGRIVFERGYGYGDLERRTAVSPSRTIFRIGSITKVFTATALVQLADRRRLQLDDDVNAHLTRVRVPSTFPQPVTSESLLTHTSGLDEISLGRKTGREADVLPLPDFLGDRLVRRQPQGQSISYGTYGISLAGEVVQEVSGHGLGDYFRREIFRPLGMRRSSLGAVPRAQRPDLATGYAWNEGTYQPQAFEYFHTFPASDINSTGRDMASFMLFQLEGAGAGRRAIMSDRARLSMQRQHFTNHPALPGMTYGFFEIRRNGIRGIEHGGVMDGYSSLLYLAPDQHLGIFVAANLETEGLRTAVRNAVLDHYHPYRLPPAPQAPVVAGSTERFAGRYQRDEYCHSCAEGERGYMPPSLRIAASGDGAISLYGARWVQVEPLLFQLTGGQTDTGDTRIAFRQDDRGRITHLFIGAWTYEHQSGTPEQPAFPVAATILASYVGTYQIQPEQIVTISLEEGKLMGRMTGFPAVELRATSETRFVGAGGDAVITFDRNDEGRAGSLTLRFGGRDMRATRIP